MSSATIRSTCRETTRQRRVHELPCRVSDPDLWFAESPTQLDLAKQMCGGCPVREGCLRAALDRSEPWGVWGGEILSDGVVIARKRPRGRPRKNSICA